MRAIKRHAEMVMLGERDAELQTILDDTGQVLALFADKDCGLSRGAVTALAGAKLVRRSWNMLGDAVHITEKGYTYLATMRGDVLDADLVVRIAALEERITELREKNKLVKNANWVSGQLGRATDAEIKLLQHDLYGLRASRRRRAGGGL